MAMSNKMLFRIVLTLVIALGAFFRLFQLGLPAFRADTIEFWRICHQDLSAINLFTHWLDIVGRTGQFPFPMVFEKALINVFHLPPSDFWIRFSSAFFGILTVPAMYMAARQIGGWRFGLFTAALLALNPFHIQMSREAYYYTPLLLGSVLMLWSVGWTFNHRKVRKKFPLYFFIVTAFGFFLLVYSHLSGLGLAALLVPFSAGIMIWRVRRFRAYTGELVILLCIYGVIGLPLILLPWAVPYFIRENLRPEVQENLVRYGGRNLPPLWETMKNIFGRMTFGTTPLRFAFTLAVLASGFAAAFLAKKRGKYLPLVTAAAFIAVLLMYQVTQRFTATLSSLRHQSVILPALLLFIAFGIWQIPLPRRWKAGKARRRAAWIFALIALSLNVLPAGWCTQLTGKPTPYKEIARFCDQSLPPGILVLVDRWFEPWNELRIYNSTNVYFTFTVPDEPEDTYRKNRWRETALNFFNYFPDAAYLELNRVNRDVRGIVSSVNFARHAAFTNQAAIELRNLGLAYREDCYSPQLNRLIIDIFYNTRDDIITRARNEGRKYLMFYGPGWSYTKLWQQTGDFRDWRIMAETAAVDVYNLAGNPVRIDLILRGVAANGSKRVAFISQAPGPQAAAAYYDFANRQLQEWQLKGIDLQPGMNRLRLRDPLWSIAKNPLLVDFVRIIETGGTGKEGN
jgi:hypothetical protein